MLALQAERPRVPALTARRLRRACRAAERRQVDAGQRDRRPQGRDRLRLAADDAPRDPRRRDRRDDAQLVLVDLPGVQRPRDALTERMQRRVERELADADAALFVLNGEQGVGPGDRFIAERAAAAEVPVIIAVNKIDRLDRAAHRRALQRGRRLDVATRSSRSPLAPARASGRWSSTSPRCCPRAPFFFQAGERSDQPSEVMLAELIREQVLRRTLQEAPHAVEVVIDELRPTRDDLTRRARAACGSRRSPRRAS